MDGSGEMDTVIALVSIQDDCDDPGDTMVATDDAAEVDQDGSVDIPVGDNDLDTSGCADEAEPTQIVSGPDNGTATINLDGTITYTPDAGFYGMDMFEYEICNCMGDCDIALVVVTVNEVIAPINTVDAVNDMDTTAANTPVTIEVLENDTDAEGDNIELVEACDPSNGTTVIFGMTIVYVPDEGFYGVDEFCYVICDDGMPQACDTAIVTVVVEAPVIVDEPPVIVDPNGDPVNDIIYDTLLVNTDPTIICLDAIDANGETVGISILENGDLGTATIDPVTGCLIYEAGPNTGTDTIIVIACDEANPDVLCDTLTVVLEIEEPDGNLPPDFVDEYGYSADTLYYTTPEDTPFTDCLDIVDPNDDNVVVTIETNGMNGMGAIVNDTCLTYAPNMDFVGMDTLLLIACDDGNPVLCDTTLYIITVTPVNDDPVATDDMVVTGVDVPVIIDILTNDFDVDGDSLIIKDIIEGPSNGTVEINADGTVTYTPDAGFTGMDTFTYAISDGNGGCDTAEVIIVVDSDPTIVATPDDITADSNGDELCNDTVHSLDVLANDSGVGDLEIIDFTAPSNGTVALDNGLLIYTPDAGSVGEDCFEYTIADMFGQTATAEVCVTISDCTVDAPCEDILSDFQVGLTPNGDGTNDTWTLPSLESCCDDSELLIFNRWGNIVHRDENGDDGFNWDGRWDTDNGNNELVPSGTYFYCILCAGDVTDNAPGKYDGFIEVINGAQ